MVKKKFIAFVGNLPYEATDKDISDHFSFLGDRFELRMRYAPDGKSKGFCFIEVGDQNDYQKLLKMHHSKLLGRKINVELSAGGGGNSSQRKSKIKKKNEKFEKYRKSIHENAQKFKPKKDSDQPSENPNN
jgi:nucleolar protein 6